MLLSHKTAIKLSDNYINIVGHMCYAAYKLWNVCNYERRNFNSVSGQPYPDWYYQKRTHKDDLWFKNLPSQTAQEVCKLLDKAWRSFFSLKKTKWIENPQPPRYKHKNIAITYMQKGIVHQAGSDEVRLSLPKQLKTYLFEKYGINDNFLFLKNKLFKSIDNIKQIKIYPPENKQCDVIIIYEIEDIPLRPDNDKYLSIDLGLHNLMTCYNSFSHETFIIGRKYLSSERYYNKKIAKIQSQWDKTQVKRGIKYPKLSKHALKVYEKKNNVINDYLHKTTKTIADYCVSNNINTVVIGDITGIRTNNNKGKVTNQKIHSLPYKKIYTMLKYKLVLKGINFIKQEESYSSQCSPCSVAVSKTYANKNNRVFRGLYKDDNSCWNADAVGAYNILRKYLFSINKELIYKQGDIPNPYIKKVAV